MSNTNYTDFSEVYSALLKVGKNADGITAKAINKAGEVGRKKLEQTVPYYDGKKYNGKKYQDYRKEHFRDNTVLSKATKSKHTAEIGFNGDVAWRVHFTELGTMKQRPQRFIEKTMEQVEAEVEKIILQAMKEAFLK